MEKPPTCQTAQPISRRDDEWSGTEAECHEVVLMGIDLEHRKGCCSEFGGSGVERPGIVRGDEQNTHVEAVPVGRLSCLIERVIDSPAAGGLVDTDRSAQRKPLMRDGLSPGNPVSRPSRVPLGR